MICQHCNKSIKDNAKYCPICGTKTSAATNTKHIVDKNSGFIQRRYIRQEAVTATHQISKIPESKSKKIIILIASLFTIAIIVGFIVGRGHLSPTSQSSQDLPDATIGVFYEYTDMANGLDTYGIISGDLPQGLSLSSGGIISGTPIRAGYSMFAVQDLGASNGDSPPIFSFNIRVKK
jgi:ribosomal protein L44E